ncbi:MAG: hypothetical protein U0Y10_16485 [Spirosomataceae bacterium]
MKSNRIDPSAFLFDFSFLIIGFWIEPIVKNFLTHHLFSNETTASADANLGVLVLTAMIAQGVGLYLRRKRMAYSVAQQKIWDTWFAMPLFFILIAHFTLYGIILNIIAVVSFNPEANGFWFLATLPIVVFTTWMAIKATFTTDFTPPTQAEHYFDWLGTFLLIFSGIVLVGAIWEGLFTANIGQNSFKEDSFGDKIGETLVLLLFFIMFYLPARLSFLICDFNNWRSWLRYLLVFLPLMKSIWF